MIYSMTGYAAKSLDVGNGALNVELRSINARYFDCHFRICDEFHSLEPALRDLLVKRLGRGKVECRVFFNASTESVRNLSLNGKLLASIKRLDAEIRQALPLAAPLSVAEVLHWPGMLGEETVDFDLLAPKCLALADEALDELIASRAREGSKLATVISEKVGRMQALIRDIEPRIPAAQAVFNERLRQRMFDSLQTVDDERIRQEVALFAARVDVAEELVRLSTHLEEVRRILDTGGASGKRLDFLMQELNREANTLGSKSMMIDVSQAAMEFKLLIEQMREQIQNLE
ncbi:MAG TPA: YicC family protein [Accumulibacter sp.]|nr:YicC family protein [Accumulibacter sp.]HPP46529.1 YicC family protein [Accumulibacter sp.]